MNQNRIENNVKIGAYLFSDTDEDDDNKETTNTTANERAMNKEIIKVTNVVKYESEDEEEEDELYCTPSTNTDSDSDEDEDDEESIETCAHCGRTGHPSYNCELVRVNQSTDMNNNAHTKWNESPETLNSLTSCMIRMNKNIIQLKDEQQKSQNLNHQKQRKFMEQIEKNISSQNEIIKRVINNSSQIMNKNIFNAIKKVEHDQNIIKSQNNQILQHVQKLDANMNKIQMQMNMFSHMINEQLNIKQIESLFNSACSEKLIPTFGGFLLKLFQNFSNSYIVPQVAKGINTSVRNYNKVNNTEIENTMNSLKSDIQRLNIHMNEFMNENENEEKNENKKSIINKINNILKINLNKIKNENNEFMNNLINNLQLSFNNSMNNSNVNQDKMNQQIIKHLVNIDQKCDKKNLSEEKNENTNENILKNRNTQKSLELQLKQLQEHVHNNMYSSSTPVNQNSMNAIWEQMQYSPSSSAMIYPAYEQQQRPQSLLMMNKKMNDLQEQLKMLSMQNYMFSMKLRNERETMGAVNRMGSGSNSFNNDEHEIIREKIMKLQSQLQRVSSSVSNEANVSNNYNRRSMQNVGGQQMSMADFLQFKQMQSQMKSPFLNLNPNNNRFNESNVDANVGGNDDDNDDEFLHEFCFYFYFLYFVFCFYILEQERKVSCAWVKWMID